MAVFGSFMIDLCTYCSRMPLPGETLIGREFKRGFGGKGANQAAMSALLGANTLMIGCLGSDDFGRSYASHFATTGVQLSLKPCPSDVAISTGVAQITVTDSGENHIVIVPGANLLLSPDDVTGSLCQGLDEAKVVVCQTEVPLDAVAAALRRGKKAGAITLLNTAPMPTTEEGRNQLRALLPLADVVCANESEAAMLCATEACDVTAWLQGIRELGCVTPLVTLGGEGAAWLDASGHVRRVTAPKVTPVDTTGAGDAFIGCLAACLAEGAEMEAAIGGAVRIASDSVRKKGTQSSYASGEEARKIMRQE